MLARHLMTRVTTALLLLSASVSAARDSGIIAHVGPEPIEARTLVERIAKLPEYQRAALGETPELLKRAVLERELVPELLYSQEAQRRKLAEQPAFAARRRELLRDALDRDLARSAAPVPEADIQAYFEQNRREFEMPRRLRLWRIVVADEALARRIITESRAADGLQRWNQFSRELSLDKATHLRNGDLGFVRPDGDTDTPTLRVDARLFAAADTVADGELVPEPVKDGDHWAVIWRRGSLKAVTRTLADEHAAIRRLLRERRLAAARAELLGRLREQYLSRLNEAPLEQLKFDEQGLPARANTAARPPHPAPALAAPPASGERGER